MAEIGREASHGKISFANGRQPFIVQRLAQASAFAARSAIQNFASDDLQILRLAAIDAGMAAEYLLKAILADRDLALIADGKDAYSVVALSAANPHPKIDFVRLKTAKTEDLLSRTLQFSPGLTIRNDYLKLQDTRNAAAHLAHANEPDLVVAVQALVRFCDSVLLAFRLNADEFWSPPLLDHLQQIRSDEVTSTTLRLSAKIASARNEIQEIATKFGASEAHDRHTIAERVMLGSLSNSTDYIQQEVVCPVCNYTGVESFYLHRDGSDAVTEIPDLSNKGAYLFYRNAYPVADEFRCGVCGLHLYEDEIRVQGLPYELEPVEELLEDYEPPESEPDWDWLLGR
jgi:hypothetical protein